MVGVGIQYFVGDSIKPFQSQNKHHNINPPPSSTYPPRHSMPHALLLQKMKTKKIEITTSHRIASHLSFRNIKEQILDICQTPQI